MKVLGICSARPCLSHHLSSTCWVGRFIPILPGRSLRLREVSGKARIQTLLRPSPNPCAQNSPTTTPLQLTALLMTSLLSLLILRWLLSWPGPGRMRAAAPAMTPLFLHMHSQSLSPNRSSKGNGVEGGRGAARREGREDSCHPSLGLI